MQTLGWYIQRFRAMTPQEVFWRIHSSLRDSADRCLLSSRQRTRPLDEVCNGNGTPVVPDAPRLCDVDLGEWMAAPSSSPQGKWRDRLVEKADRIASHRMSLFDMDDVFLGDEIDWHRDFKNGVAAPLKFAPAIDYRDVASAGDCKWVWEPGRNHQVVTLARAYRATGNACYAAAAAEWIESWLRNNPYGLGMNWRSPLELAIRLINWTFAADYLAGSEPVGGAFRGRLLESVHRHVWEIARKYSRASSANNHLVGEAAGVFVATSYFSGLKGAEPYARQAREILCREILAQTYADGGNREQAFAYHLFVAWFFVVAGVVARRTGLDMPREYWQRLEKMMEFAAAMLEGGPAPMFGDADDGYVLDLGNDKADAKSLLAVGAVLFDRPDFVMPHADTESVRWLLGRESVQKLATIPPASPELESRRFAESGYCLLQYGRRGERDAVSVLFDCGELGFGPLAAHGHADAMSFTLRAFGQDVLVDPGTYDYFSYARWREYFRSTRAHNTVTLDSQDQSEMLGRFLWGRRANVRCVEFRAREGGRVSAEHDGYQRLENPATHRRTLTLNGPSGELVIQDEILSDGEHEVHWRLHFTESCQVQRIGDSEYEIRVAGRRIRLEVDSRLETSLFCGSEEPMAGWVSRGYHRKSPAMTLVGRCISRGNLALNSRIVILPQT